MRDRQMYAVMLILTVLFVPLYALVNVSPSKGKRVTSTTDLTTVMTVSDWFIPSPPQSEFDLDGNGLLSVVEEYNYVKVLRVGLNKSDFIINADIDKNGYVDSTEWEIGIAFTRVNGLWIQVFDQDKDGKLSLNEEVQGVRYMGRVYEMYKATVHRTATYWQSTWKENAEEFVTSLDANSDYKIDQEELNKYLEDNQAEINRCYDWDSDGELTGVELATAFQMFTQSFNEFNKFLQGKKAIAYRNIL